MESALTGRSEAATAGEVRARLPEGGLFADQSWRVATRPFPLGPELVKDLDNLGRILLQFYRATNQIYRHSLEGKQPEWVAQLLDQGKPAPLLELQRSVGFRKDIPRVIRPDLLLTDDGYAITELDSVPGGIGLTAWLNQTYDGLGFTETIGGATGMLDGFGGIFGEAPKVHLVVSEEAASYRPEMRWLAHQLGERFAVQTPDFAGPRPNEAIYRFFELFDLMNVPKASEWFAQASEKQITLTPPPKPIFEEKLLLGLLWNRNLRNFWRQQLGEGFLAKLLKVFPYTWVVDPAPLPPQGAIPELNITHWDQLKTFSQKERNLILKVSGYSEEAWGARGVYLGSDMPTAEWAAAVDKALSVFAQSPYVLQRFHKPRVVETNWFDFETQTVKQMKGRVRLCPYYFVHGEGDAARTHLGGVLATICPEDKKIIHGMRDAILAPCTT